MQSCRKSSRMHRPKGTIAEVVPGLTVLLLHAAELIDAPAELARLDKDIQRSNKELQTVQGRLQNADFVARAKPEVVEQNRARVEELTQRTAELRQHKTAIAEMAQSFFDASLRRCDTAPTGVTAFYRSITHSGLAHFGSGGMRCDGGGVFSAVWAIRFRRGQTGSSLDSPDPTPAG